MSAFAGVCDKRRTLSLLPKGRAGSSPQPGPRLFPLPGSAQGEHFGSDPLPGLSDRNKTAFAQGPGGGCGEGGGYSQETSENFQSKLPTQQHEAQKHL